MAGKPFRRGDKGDWYIVVEGTPHPETGARRQRWLHAPTRRAVLELQTKALRERDTGSAIDPTKLTLGEFVARYYETVGKQKLRATVYQVQERYTTPGVPSGPCTRAPARSATRRADRPERARSPAPACPPGVTLRGARSPSSACRACFPPVSRRRLVPRPGRAQGGACRGGTAAPCRGGRSRSGGTRYSRACRPRRRRTLGAVSARGDIAECYGVFPRSPWYRAAIAPLSPRASVDRPPRSCLGHVQRSSASCSSRCERHKNRGVCPYAPAA